MRTPPLSVNFIALPTRLVSTWRRRMPSVRMERGTGAAMIERISMPLAWARVPSKFDHAFDQAAQLHLFFFERHHARFDLGEIEDVVDQRKQRFARIGGSLRYRCAARTSIRFRAEAAPCRARRSSACGFHGSWWRGSPIWRGLPASALSRASVSASSSALRSVMSRPTLCTSTRRPNASRIA